MHRVINALQGSDLRAGLEVLPDVQVDQTDGGAERRAQSLLLDERGQTGHIGGCHVALGAGAIHVGGGRPLLLKGALHAAEHRFGQTRLGVERRELRLLDGDIQFDQQVALLDHGAGRKRDRSHRAGKFVAQHDRTQRAHGADGGANARVGRQVDLGRHHGGGELGGGLGGGSSSFLFAALDVDQAKRDAGDNDHQHHTGDDRADGGELEFGHGNGTVG